MNKLYVITGPAGVGKSTISKIIAENKEKSALIEGDDVYHFVKGGYISPWLEGNHLDVFWENSICLIKNFLNKGYDVIFNYIIGNERFENLKEEFKNVQNVEMKFVVLMVNEDTLISRDEGRPLDSQMGERSLELLKEFKEDKYDEKYILDTSDLSEEETVNDILISDRFICN